MNKKIPPSLHIFDIYLKICFLFSGCEGENAYMCVCVCVCVCVIKASDPSRWSYRWLVSPNRGIGSQAVVLLKSSKCL
jgi:hypothetical protein